MTERNGISARGSIFYDAQCRMCLAGRERWGPLFERRGFVWSPLQTPGTAARLGLSDQQLREAMQLQLPDGRLVSGADALGALMRSVWWLWPVGVLIALPGFNTAARALYRWIAHNRYCLDGSCAVDHGNLRPPATVVSPGRNERAAAPLAGRSSFHTASESFRRDARQHADRERTHLKRCQPTRRSLRLGELFLLLAPLGTVALLGRAWPAWLLMWALALVLGLFLKWITWRDIRNAGGKTPPARTLGWFLLWPGMDARAFFRSADRPDRKTRSADFQSAVSRICNPQTVAVPNRSERPEALPNGIRRYSRMQFCGTVDSASGAPFEWFAAFAKLALGIVLIWFIAPHFQTTPLLCGWVAMVGIIFCLHFGALHLLSLAWRAGGVDAPPIMKRPLAVTSLAGFWGERWNTAFSLPARRFLFKPVARRLGVCAAGLIVFIVSGLLHELVISVPARGGYGLPMAYFVLQAAGVGFERSRVGRALGLGRGFCGWLFMAMVTAGPVFWLFHPPFVRNVILPMLHALGAT